MTTGWFQSSIPKTELINPKKIAKVITRNATIIRFRYGDEGLVGFSLNSTDKYYTKDLFGNISGIYGADGTKYVSYEYDAWGNHTVTLDLYGIGTVNPFRYREYYYDTETGLYYLQSRYYDPVIGRFINADDAGTLGANSQILSYNLFAYCLNNPVNRTDDGGNLSWLAKIAIGVAVIAVAAVVTVATAGAAAPAMVAIHCAAAGALEGAAIGAATGAVTGAAIGAVSHRISTGSWEGAGQAALEGAADGFMTGAITGAVTGALTSPYCFVAGTLVQNSEGTKPIEEIQPGDWVWAWDEKTGEVALRPVMETYVNEADELVHVFVKGEEIVTTPGHPFYSPVKGWTDAIHLRAGDILVLVNGEYVVVEKVQHELLEAPIHVYNFNVAGFHTYYVTWIGVLVHNTGCTRVGNGHGISEHANRIDKTMDLLEDSGQYTQIYGNRSLNTAGLIGNQRPDIIAKDVNNVVHIWEFASPSQAGGYGRKLLIEKIAVMTQNNPGLAVHFVPW